MLIREIVFTLIMIFILLLRIDIARGENEIVGTVCWMKVIL
jgi:hypothetical protein